MISNQPTNNVKARDPVGSKKCATHSGLQLLALDICALGKVKLAPRGHWPGPGPGPGRDAFKSVPTIPVKIGMLLGAV